MGPRLILSIVSAVSRSRVADAPGRALRSGARAWEELEQRYGPEAGDALLYGAAALFALLTALVAGLSSYRVWGWIALGPYAAGAAASWWVVRRHRRRSTAGVTRFHLGSARVWVILLVLVGSALLPLGAETMLARRGPAYVQPEVVVIEQAGRRLAHGQDPYRVASVHGHIEPAPAGQPAYEAYFPYLPLMALFGVSDFGRGEVRVSDTRVAFSVVTLLVVGAALALLGIPRDRKLRVFQFFTVLPCAALPLATGGDDMPVVAFLLLAIALAQRRRPGWSGIALGVASAMKFTAWPLALLALFGARSSDGRRAPGRMLLGIVGVTGPVVAPFITTDVRAFFENVILFPLGLSGVASPAASNLPGHLLVLHLPFLHTAFPAVVALVGGALLVHRLWRRPPGSIADATVLAGVVMLVAILAAPTTRVGYLLYPLDFFVVGWALTMTGDKQPSTQPPAVLSSV